MNQNLTYQRPNPEHADPDHHRNDVAHDRIWLISPMFRIRTAEEKEIIARWVRGVGLFYSLLLLVGGAVLFVSADKTGTGQHVARASTIQNGR